MTLNFGELPSREDFDRIIPDEVYPVVIRSGDLWANVAALVNQGIDSHLEAVIVNADHTTGQFDILDRASLWTFLRRCVESDWGDNEEDDPINLASCILGGLGIEWV